MSEYTVEITSYCPNNCSYCSTNAGNNEKHLPYDKVAEFLADIKSIDRINISGGEPLSHPRFWDILQYCQSKTNDVWVYTNALKNIRYNADILREITIEANVCIIPGKLAYIPKHADKVHLLQLVQQGRARNIEPINVHASGNMRGREDCKKCDHTVLQADGQIVRGPCRKNYKAGGASDA